MLAYSRHAAQAMTIAAIMAVAGSLYVTSHARPPSTTASVHSVSAPVALPPGPGCVFQAEPAGQATILPWIKAGIEAPAKPGQFSWVLVPVTVLGPGKLSTETWPVPAGAALASPLPSPAGRCLILLNLKSPPEGLIVRTAVGVIVPSLPPDNG